MEVARREKQHGLNASYSKLPNDKQAEIIISTLIRIFYDEYLSSKPEQFRSAHQHRERAIAD